MMMKLCIRLGLFAAVFLFGVARFGHAQTILDQGAITAASASCIATACVDTEVVNVSSVTIGSRGTFTGTIEVEATNDGGVTWSPWYVRQQTDLSRDTSITTTGFWVGTNDGYTAMRVRASAWTSGTATITITRGFTSGGDSAGSAGGGAAQADNTALGDITGAGALYDTTPPAVTDGSVGIPRMNSSRQLLVDVAALPTLPTGANTIGSVNVLLNGANPSLAICSDPDKVVMLNINLSAATGNQQLVALSGSTRVYVCALDIMADGTEVIVQLIRGTGTACATGETDMGTWKFNATIGWGFVKGKGGESYGRTNAGDALCLETSASVAIFGSLSYVQQ